MSVVEKEIEAPASSSSSSAVVVRFAGDSGDGMQLTGSNFTEATALHGNDLATFPDFPAEIRAPAGATFGVSAFQIYFGADEVTTAPSAEPNHARAALASLDLTVWEVCREDDLARLASSSGIARSHPEARTQCLAAPKAVAHGGAPGADEARRSRARRREQIAASAVALPVFPSAKDAAASRTAAHSEAHSSTIPLLW